MRSLVAYAALVAAAASAGSTNALLREVYGDLAELAEFFTLDDPQEAAELDGQLVDEEEEEAFYNVPQQYYGGPQFMPRPFNAYVPPPSYGGYHPYMGLERVGKEYERFPQQPVPPPSFRPTNSGRTGSVPLGNAAIGGAAIGAGLPVPPQADIPNAPPSRIESFAGRWECDTRYSKPVDGILAALGVAPIKIRILDNRSPTTFIGIKSNNVLRMENKLPGGSSVGGNVPLDGSEFVHSEQETGNWRTRAGFDGEKLVQVRQSPRGVMYDVRAVYDSHPLTHSPGTWMLFKWSFQPTGGVMTTADRWLRKTG